ncbi:hemerythrin domain-containing protein [Nitrosospira briensis]|uniref:hemerythrin domain-containing protein n=1 Tax=Nitrosospira briensis TaxID=35799 RepID=UPI0004681C39|nr:hemerythrin domain-containing protein [Nitrosospira briensis]
MPRIGALLVLSREHHTSLVVARDARRAANEKDAVALVGAIARIEAHWKTVMAAHFDEEERLIRIAEDTLEAQAVARILAEHAELRALANEPCPLEPAMRLRRFADLIVTHVRFEERVFFPQLQSHPCIANADA